MAAEQAAVVVDVPVGVASGDLLRLPGGVSDGRSSQGRDHPAGVVLALAAAATVAGMKGYTAMAGWVADVPEGVVTDLYLRAGVLPAGRPSRSRMWRVCTDADAQALDAAIGTWLAGLAAEHPDDRGSGDGLAGQAMVQVRLDGKTVRGATDAEGNQPHLLAALAGPPDDPGRCVVVAQAQVTGAKTNEPATAQDILGALDLDGKTVTADALHTVKATADLIHRRGGQFVLPVKQNRQALFDALDALPWQQVPISHSTVEKGHGRITRRGAVAFGSLACGLSGLQPRSDRQGQLGECLCYAPAGKDLDADLVVPAAEVLHEGVPGDDYLGGPIGSKSPHRSEPVLELAVIGLDRIVRMALDVMPRLRHQFLEHSRVDRSGIGDHLDRLHLQRGQRP
jgi:predicted transposase YbfD/YdcC